MKQALAAAVGALMVTLGNAAPAHETPMTLAGSEWGFGGGDPRFIQFQSDGQVAGSGGCNNFFGGYTQKGMRIAIGPLASTQMACEPDVMNDEQTFFLALDRAEAFRASNKVLKLLDAEAALLLELQRRGGD